MNRRRFLTGIGAASGALLAGCAGPGKPTTLENPDVSGDGPETHLTYRDDDGRIATTSVQYGPVRTGGLVRLHVSIWHRDGTTVTDLAVTLRNREPTAVRPTVYVGGFSGEFPPIEYRIDEETESTTRRAGPAAGRRGHDHTRTVRAAVR